MKKTFVSSLIAVFLTFQLTFAATIWDGCYGSYSSNANYNSSLDYRTDAMVTYQSQVEGGISNTITVSNLRFQCSENNLPPEECSQVAGNSTGAGSFEITAPVTLSAQMSYPPLLFQTTRLDGTSSQGNSNFPDVYHTLEISAHSTSANFTAPTQAGTYTIDGWADTGGETYMGSGTGVCPLAINYTVTAPASAACSDSLNNDGAEGADTLDPQCHTDCNVNNAASYVSSHTSESTPPNGSCPAPTLNLSGRSAGSFLHFLANLFTSKAIAQETSEVKATTIASVNIYGGAIKEVGINTLEAGFTLKSDLGTQAGVRYGVVIKKKDSQEVVDTFAGPETLSLKYAEYVYKSLTYTSPITLNGEHDVYLEVTTDSNIPLATKKLGTYSFIKERDTQTFVKSCTFDMNAFNATCVVGNKDKVSPTDVLLVTDVRKGGALGALIQAQQVTPLTFDAQGLSTTILPMLREPGTYTLDVTLVQTQRPLSHTVYEYRITGNGEMVIDNVFVEQADKKTFSVGVVSLSSSQEAQNVVVYLTKNGKVLAESSSAFMRPRTDVALTYKGFSTPDAVRVAITKADGTVLVEKTTPYTSPFEKKAGITFGWGALIVLAIIVIGYIVSLLRRRV